MLMWKKFTHNKHATGVRMANGSTLAADIVVFGGDPETCYKHLIPGIKIAYPRQKRYSMGLYVLYFGTKNSIPKSLITVFGWAQDLKNCYLKFLIVRK